MASSITIDAKYLTRIKSIIGYPKIDNLGILTEDQIKDLCIAPALEAYFRKFPKRSVQQIYITSQDYREIPFPDTRTFGVLEAHFIEREGTTGLGANNFWSMVQFQNTNPYFSTQYGIANFNPNGLRQQNLTRWQAIMSTRNTYKTEMFDTDLENRKFVVHTNIAGTLQIDWAKDSDNFADVKFQQRDNVIRLSQANLLKQIINIPEMMKDGEIPVDFNVDILKTKATELEDKVLAEWLDTQDITLVSL